MFTHGSYNNNNWLYVLKYGCNMFVLIIFKLFIYYNDLFWLGISNKDFSNKMLFIFLKIMCYLKYYIGYWV